METGKEFIFEWKLVNFYMYPNKNVPFSSPEFIIESLCKSKWYLDFDRSYDSDYASFDLYRVDCSDRKELSIDFSVEVTNCYGETLVSNSGSSISSDNGYASQLCMFDNDMFYNVDEISDSFITIRCCFKSLHMTRNETKCEAISKVIFDSYNFKWVIDNSNCTSCASRKFHYRNDVMQLEIAVSNPELEDTLKITVRKLDDLFGWLNPLVGRIALLNNDEMEVNTKCDMFSYENIHEIWEFPAFINKKLLMPDKNNLKDNSFVLLCDFLLPKTVSSAIRYIRNGIPLTIDTVQNLQKDFRSMLDSNMLSDLKMNVDGEIFQAHKCIMAARSPVFRKMFEQDMLESRTNVVNIEDIEKKTMKSLLSFLYTGELDDMDCDSKLKLLLAAEKYQIDSLREKCSLSLMNSLKVENVCEVLNVAAIIKLQTLKSTAIDYIMEHSKEVLSSEECKQLVVENIQVATEVIYTFSDTLVKVA